MREPSETKLAELSQKIQECATSEEKREVLTRAFEFYAEESVKLEKAHADLIKKFELLQNEFTETNLLLKIKLDELDAVNDYLNSLLYNMSQGLIFIDLRGNITTFNHAAAQILDIPIENALFHLFSDVFPDQYFGFSMKETLQNKKLPSLSHLTLTHNGQEKKLELNGTFVLQTDPPEGAIDLQGLIILIRDITAIERLQTEENRNNRLKQLGEMAAMVAHEIRNPLGGIKGFASLLERDLQDRPEQQQMASYIIEGTDNLNTLVTNVLSYSRPLKLECETVDVVALCRDLFIALEADPNTPKNIQLKFTTPLPTLPAWVDSQHLKGALLNLIFNAIQAMPNGGNLTLSLFLEEGKITIEVIDEGSGISLENQKKIFSPFFTTKPKGNGLGLSEVYKVVEAHHGSINFRSDPGKGTTFTIKIPLTTASGAKNGDSQNGN